MLEIKLALFQITLLQAAIAIGYIMIVLVGFVFLAGMLTCVPIVMKELRKAGDKEASIPQKLPYYRQPVYFIISIVISSVIMAVVCLLFLVGLSVFIGPIM